MPYVGFSDIDSGNRATVMKFGGSGWAIVGSQGFSAGSVTYEQLAINNAGTPYIAYTDFGNGQKATVMKYNGSAWVNEGTAGFSAGQVSYTSIALDTGGTPYVCYADIANGYKCTVMKFGSGGWVSAGGVAFTDSTVLSTHIAFDNSGTPYIVYAEGISFKASVMKLTPGTAIPGASAVVNQSLTLFPNPAHGSFFVNVASAMKEDALIIVTNTLGAKVKELSVPSNTNAEVELNTPGIYFISAITKAGNVTGKLVVE